MSKASAWRLFGGFFCICLFLPDAIIAHASSPGQLLLTLNNPRPPGPGFTNGFATAVTAVGDRIMVGVTYDDFAGPNAGSVDIYNATSGAYIDSIFNPYPYINSQFGSPLTTLGSQLVVGQPLAYSDGSGGYVEGGLVYRFDPITKQQVGTVADPSPQYQSHFGNSIASFGGNILVGAPLQSPAGAAFLIDGGTGSLGLQFNNPSPHGLDWFGQSVSSFGTNVVVGAPGFDISGNANQNVGRAYVFNGTTGSLLGAVNNPFPADAPPFGQQFGAIVQGLSHNFAVVGAGQVYLFDGTTYQLTQTLVDGSANFKLALAAVGNDLLVGSQSSESAYLFDGDTGKLLLTLHNPDAINHPDFGQSVAFDGDKLIVGAFEAAYVFQNVPEPSTLMLVVLALPGCFATMRATRRCKCNR